MHEKLKALQAFTEHIGPNRWVEIHQPTIQELAQTLVLSVLLQETSAKVRTGPPMDDEPDCALPVWAGELPLRTVSGEAIPAPRLSLGIKVSDPIKF